ncbi:putative sensory transduction regulator [Rhodovulum imhoffii]|uniref:Putative sensory transduction regulator n=1 Tax=Rhodovulum imhoffii TaxID=365340 RepID=A0A2T5BUA2_9RHOB|nr:YbjN domain-containing protein [Rhodovulum imhoffii]MBK5934546.1 hypothetical protein [Rhodovulum imhoffii]PTN03037.1 putative sensory transduction regulator [Rhodovulum imhoffii]
MRSFFRLCAPVFLGLMAAPAAAENVMAANPQQVLEAVQAYGFSATLGTDSHDDPEISGRVSKTNFHIVFHGCDGHENCSVLLFLAAYDKEDPMTAQQINIWNMQKLFGRAVLDDEGDPRLEMPVNLDYDGVGAKNFEDTLDWWRIAVEEFEDFIDWD